MSSELLQNTAVAASIDLLSAWIEAQMAYQYQPGLSIGLISGQHLFWSKGFGYADTENQTPATPETIYRIASITKLFTSTAVMQLRDQGKLQLDDPVSKHLPWFNMKGSYPESPVITIRHLLTHTGGLPREVDFPYWDDGNFPDRAQIQARLSEQETTLPTETEWKYSNLALTLAGEVVAAVSGEEYETYVREHILQPLSMGNSYIETIEPDHPLLATGYSRRLPEKNREIAPFTDCRGITPAANMASNVNDLAQFALFHLGTAHADSILRASSRREMQRVHWLNEDWTAGRGLGFYVWRFEGHTLAGHGGALRGYRTDLQICPAAKFGVVVLTNADDGNPLQYTQKAIQWVLPAVQKATERDAEKSEQQAAWQSYVGRYRNAWGDLQVMILEGKLVAINPSLADPKAGQATLTPVSPHTFKIETKENFSTHGELAVFELDETGKVQRLKLGSTYTYPIEAW